MKKLSVYTTSMKYRCMVEVLKSEDVTRAKTTTTMTTSRSRLELSQTTELYTGDIVELRGFDKKADGVQFQVTKTVSPAHCESGVEVTVVHGSLSYTVDRHWLTLIVKASEIDFNDDIPF